MKLSAARRMILFVGLVMLVLAAPDGGDGGKQLSFLVGIVVSGLVGFVAVKWFLRMIRIRGLRSFGVYCFLAMTAGLLTALARG